MNSNKQFKKILIHKFESCKTVKHTSVSKPTILNSLSITLSSWTRTTSPIWKRNMQNTQYSEIPKLLVGKITSYTIFTIRSSIQPQDKVQSQAGYLPSEHKMHWKLSTQGFKTLTKQSQAGNLPSEHTMHWKLLTKRFSKPSAWEIPK